LRQQKEKRSRSVSQSTIGRRKKPIFLTRSKMIRQFSNYSINLTFRQFNLKIML